MYEADCYLPLLGAFIYCAAIPVIAATMLDYGPYAFLYFLYSGIFMIVLAGYIDSLPIMGTIIFILLLVVPTILLIIKDRSQGGG